ncbi:MAG: GNAT family N-acetyltransferase [Chitinophagales bacterium]
MNSKITLRPATINDIPILQYWDTQAHVIESDPNDDWNWEIELQRSPDWREQLVAELEGKAIGFVQIIDPELEETHYWGEVQNRLRAIDIWIGEKGYLGKGYGTQIMYLAIERCFANQEVTAILIDPLLNNVKAHRFYERLGFRFVEFRTFGEDDCKVYQLIREDWMSK